MSSWNCCFGTTSSARRKALINSDGFRVINIQNLSDKHPQHEIDQAGKEHIPKLIGKEIIARNDKYNADNVYYENSNCQNCLKGLYGNSFIGAFLEAYNQHRDIILSPDDIWNQIMLMLSKHINDNAEQLRSRFVKHERQKEIKIIEFAPSLERSKEMEKEWEETFFSEILQQIKANTVDGVVDNLKSSFSTTSPFEELFSVAVIMDSFQKYFTYHRYLCSCGINNIRFLGTHNDWLQLLTKTENLSQYSLTKGDKWSLYISHVVVILKQFISTYEDRVDVNWWNQIVATEEHRIGSGDDIQTNIEGWILHFIGIYTSTSLDSLPTHSISVPIKLTNEFTNSVKNLTLLGGFTGVHYSGNGAYRPQLSMISVLYYFTPQNEHSNEEEQINVNCRDNVVPNEFGWYDLESLS